MNTTVCEHDNATFTCAIFLSSGVLVIPGWLRNGATVDMIRHIRDGNLTIFTTTPAYISGTLTVINVTISDNGALYQCGIGPVLSNSATLNVVGKCICHDLMFPFVMNVSVA